MAGDALAEGQPLTIDSEPPLALAAGARISGDGRRIVVPACCDEQSGNEFRGHEVLVYERRGGAFTRTERLRLMTTPGPFVSEVHASAGADRLWIGTEQGVRE